MLRSNRLRQSVREEQVPRLDVRGIEARIFTEVSRSDTSSAFVPIPQRRRWPAWTAVSVAAAVSLFIATHAVRHSSDLTTTSPARGELAQSDAIDGHGLVIGQVIEARRDDVTIKHANATWRLMANGRAQIVENDADRITVALEYGLIQADVVPREKPESFAIEVASTRVAVHGTLFSVERRGDVAEVVVREGRVMVGPNDQRGNVKGTLLTAPSRARLDVGLPQSALTENVGTNAETKRQSRATGAMHPGRIAESTHGTTPLPERPSSADLDHAWSAVATEVASCFAEHTTGSPSVRVSFKTHLSLTIDTSGKVTDIGFNPPVPEPVRSCTLARVSSVTTSPSVNGAVVSRPTMLTR
ncbi:MAG: FecR domain-containing protein [Polyangiaceae bacterium]